MTFPAFCATLTTQSKGFMNAKLAALTALKYKHSYAMQRIYGIIKQQVSWGQFSADIYGEKPEDAAAFKIILESDGYVVDVARTNLMYSSLKVSWSL